MIRRPPIYTLFPSPPLFRSPLRQDQGVRGGVLLRDRGRPQAPPHLTAARPLPRSAGELLDQGVARRREGVARRSGRGRRDRKSTRLNSSHANISYAVFCLKKTITSPIRSA